MADDPLPPQTHTQPPDARQRLGHALRDKCTRASHAAWAPPAGPRDPIAILIEQGKSRLPELLPKRYARMAESPFAFLRGAAAVMAADLAPTPSTGLLVQAAGDCHCMNFGGFATPEKRLSFDINDFDETAVAPWEWDLKRLATSFVVATMHDFDKDTRRNLARALAHAYREEMTKIATDGLLESWYRSLTLDDDKDLHSIGLPQAVAGKPDDKSKHRPLLINVDVDQDGSKLKDKPPDLYHPPAGELPTFLSDVQKMLSQYRESLIPERRVLLGRFRFADAAYKVVGVGSVGTLCGVALMISGNGERLRLQFKEAAASVLEAFGRRSPYTNHGERVVRGQRLLQAAPDFLLGFGVGPRGKDCYVRQLRNAKIKPVLDNLSADSFRRYARTCGEVLARAHARSGDAVVLAAYLGSSDEFDAAIGDFALAYGRQTELDHASLLDAIKHQRVPVEERDS